MQKKKTFHELAMNFELTLKKLYMNFKAPKNEPKKKHFHEL